MRQACYLFSPFAEVHITQGYGGSLPHKKTTENGLVGVSQDAFYSLEETQLPNSYSHTRGEEIHCLICVPANQKSQYRSVKDLWPLRDSEIGSLVNSPTVQINPDLTITPVCQKLKGIPSLGLRVDSPINLII